MYNLELKRKAPTMEEQVRELGETLEAEWGKMSRHLEEEVTKYKTLVGFRKMLERSRVVLYKFGYLITLTCFKTRDRKSVV